MNGRSRYRMSIIDHHLEQGHRRGQGRAEGNGLAQPPIPYFPAIWPLISTEDTASSHILLMRSTNQSLKPWLRRMAKRYC